VVRCGGVVVKGVRSNLGANSASTRSPTTMITKITEMLQTEKWRNRSNYGTKNVFAARRPVTVFRTVTRTQIS